MNYRMTQEFKPPFRVSALIEEAGQLKVGSSFFSSPHYYRMLPLLLHIFYT